MRPSSFSSGAGCVVSASVLEDVETAVTESSTVMETGDSASESLSVVTLFVVESLLDVEPAAVPSSVSRMPSVAAGGSLSVDLEALVPVMECASSSPKPVDFCMGTTTSVA